MASEAEVLQVRRNADEPGEDPYSTDYIRSLVDTLGGVQQATAQLWQEKAARYARLVDTTEAGASRMQSQVYDHALTQVRYYGGAEAGGAGADGADGRVRIGRIVRT